MTRLLALETSGTSGSVAAFDGDRLLGRLTLDPALRSARSLAPGIQQVLREAGWKPREVQLVAVTAGPGSFTGLRIGLTTARTFAYAVGAQLLGINTLEVLTEQAPRDARVVRAVLDAQRQELFAATYSRQADGSWSNPARQMPAIMSIDAWLATLSAGDVVIGPILAKLRARLPSLIHAAPETSWMPDAATVGRIAARRFAAGERHDLWSLAPLYLRRSAAEEKADAIGA